MSSFVGFYDVFKDDFWPFLEVADFEDFLLFFCCSFMIVLGFGVGSLLLRSVGFFSSTMVISGGGDWGGGPYCGMVFTHEPSSKPTPFKVREPSSDMKRGPRKVSGLH